MWVLVYKLEIIPTNSPLPSPSPPQQQPPPHTLSTNCKENRKKGTRKIHHQPPGPSAWHATSTFPYPLPRIIIPLLLAPAPHASRAHPHPVRHGHGRHDHLPPTAPIARASSNINPVRTGLGSPRTPNPSPHCTKNNNRVGRLSRTSVTEKKGRGQYEIGQIY